MSVVIYFDSSVRPATCTQRGPTCSLVIRSLGPPIRNWVKCYKTAAYDEDLEALIIRAKSEIHAWLATSLQEYVVADPNDVYGKQSQT